MVFKSQFTVCFQSPWLPDNPSQLPTAILDLKREDIYLIQISPLAKLSLLKQLYYLRKQSQRMLPSPTCQELRETAPSREELWPRPICFSLDRGKYFHLPKCNLGKLRLSLTDPRLTLLPPTPLHTRIWGRWFWKGS